VRDLGNLLRHEYDRVDIGDHLTVIEFYPRLNTATTGNKTGGER
jgi:hypothetical protein